MIPNQLSNSNAMAKGPKGNLCLKNPAELIFHGLQHHPLQGSACLEAAVIRLSHRNLLPKLAGWSDQTFLPLELIFQPVVFLQVENWIWLCVEPQMLIINPSNSIQSWDWVWMEKITAFPQEPHTNQTHMQRAKIPKWRNVNITLHPWQGIKNLQS